MTAVTKQQDARSMMEQRVGRILTENKDWGSRYKVLAKMLECGDPDLEMRALRTFQVMENQRQVMEQIKRKPQMESTFTQALGDLVPKVIDLVRIFYPNLVAQDLCDIQPMDRQNGEIFKIKPVFSNSAGGVTAGQQVFQNITDGTYASTLQSIQLTQAAGDATGKTFTGTIPNFPIRPGSVFVVVNTGGSGDSQFVNGRDYVNSDPNVAVGQIIGTGIASGSVNYATGVVTVVLDSAPSAATGLVGTATGGSQYEQNPAVINSVDIQMSLLPVTAQPHPLRVKWSAQAQLAAAAHLDLDVGDILTNLAASFIRQERDIGVINTILSSAIADPNLNFDATAPTNYSVLAKYAQIGLKLNYAESQIQRLLGRGGVSWVLCGTNAADIWRNAADFEPSGIVAPIGPHKIGTLRDGTVAVIKVPSMNANSYVIGFKGYVIGDASIILAEWVPLFATPVFQAPDLTNQQGMMSMYALVQNEVQYFRSGTISNYTAG